MAKSQRFRPVWTRWLVLALLAVVLTACGSSRNAAPQTGAPGTSGGESTRGSVAADAAAPSPAPAPAKPAAPPPPMVPGQAAASKPNTSSGGPMGSGTGIPTLPDPTADRKLIMNADISLKVTEARAAVQAIQDLVNFNHGYVADSNLNGSEADGWNGKIVVRIPNTSYGEVLSKLRQLGEVRQERQWTEDVTDQFIDVNARLTILKEYEQRLRELALKADKFEDWSRLIQQQNEVRIQIESLTGRLRVLDNRVALSTLTISLLQPGAKAKETPKADASLAERMAVAFKESIKALVEAGTGLMVFLAGFIPVAAILALLGWGALKLVRSIRKPHAARPSDRESVPPANPGA